MSLRRGVLLAILLFLLIRLLGLRGVLYQNAGYTALNHAHSKTQQLGAYRDYSLAVSRFETALDMRQAYSSTRGLGFALMYLGEEEAALQTWATLPVAMQDELVSWGDIALEAVQYETAIAWYEKALSLNNEQSICPLMHRLGRAYELVGKPMLARQQFLLCVQSGELYVDAYVALCFSYVNEGKVDEAVALWASLDEASRRDSSLLSCVGVGYMGEKNYGEALAYFKEAVTVDPERASLYQWLSLAYTRAGNFTEAIASAEQATMLDGSRIDFWQHLANLYRETGQNEAATAVLKKIATLEQTQINQP